jgi:predicted nucleotidyltransferase
MSDSSGDVANRPEALADRLREALPGILENEPARVAYLYGSHATGLATPFSDVDIALVLGRPIAPLERLRLMLRVQLALYHRCDILEADVRVIDDAPIIFRGRVVTEGILLYSRDEETRVDFEVRTRMLYFDYLPVYEQLQAEMLRHVRERGLHG